MEPLHILVADDHPLFRHGLVSLFNSISEFEVVGEASSGQEVILMAASLQPDVILMDIQMPGVNGIEATRQILHTSPHIRILVVTMFEDDNSVFSAMRAGARGYILKDAHKSEILRAIRAVGNSEAIFSAAVASRLIEFFAVPRPTAIPPQAFPELTEREREILELIAKGQNNLEISSHLSLSHNTVRNYVSNIFSKLQVADRAQAIVRAREAGLGEGRSIGF